MFFEKHDDEDMTVITRNRSLDHSALSEIFSLAVWLTIWPGGSRDCMRGVRLIHADVLCRYVLVKKYMQALVRGIEEGDADLGRTSAELRRSFRMASTSS